MRVHAHYLLRNTNAYRRSFSDSQVLQEIQTMITPILLCGGSGTRLWPLSRKSFPSSFPIFWAIRACFRPRPCGSGGRALPVGSSSSRHMARGMPELLINPKDYCTRRSRKTGKAVATGPFCEKGKHDPLRS